MHMDCGANRKLPYNGHVDSWPLLSTDISGILSIEALR